MRCSTFRFRAFIRVAVLGALTAFPMLWSAEVRAAPPRPATGPCPGRVRASQAKFDAALSRARELYSDQCGTEEYCPGGSAEVADAFQQASCLFDSLAAQGYDAENAFLGGTLQERALHFSEASDRFRACIDRSKAGSDLYRRCLFHLTTIRCAQPENINKCRRVAGSERAVKLWIRGGEGQVSSATADSAPVDEAPPRQTGTAVITMPSTDDINAVREAMSAEDQAALQRSARRRPLTVDEAPE
jgi:hypothetical protein